MTEPLRFPHLIVASCLVGVLTASIPDAVYAQPTLGDANVLITSGRQNLRDGAEMEEVGEFNGAMQAYMRAANDASQALQIGDIQQVPFDQKPAGLYYLYGQSTLSLAQLGIKLRDDPVRINGELVEAEQAFRDAIVVVDRQYPTGSWEWVGRKSEAIFSLGTVFFIRGDLRRARNAMRDVLRLDSEHWDARYSLEAIDYLEGRRPQRQTSGGRTIPRPPSGESSGGRVMEYAVEIGKALFGRWGSVAGMLLEDLFQN